MHPVAAVAVILLQRIGNRRLGDGHPFPVLIGLRCLARAGGNSLRIVGDQRRSKTLGNGTGLLGRLLLQPLLRRSDTHLAQPPARGRIYRRPAQWYPFPGVQVLHFHRKDQLRAAFAFDHNAVCIIIPVVPAEYRTAAFIQDPLPLHKTGPALHILCVHQRPDQFIGIGPLQKRLQAFQRRVTPFGRNRQVFILGHFPAVRQAIAVPQVADDIVARQQLLQNLLRGIRGSLRLLLNRRRGAAGDQNQQDSEKPYQTDRSFHLWVTPFRGPALWPAGLRPSAGATGFARFPRLRRGPAGRLGRRTG